MLTVLHTTPLLLYRLVLDIPTNIFQFRLAGRIHFCIPNTNTHFPIHQPKENETGVLYGARYVWVPIWFRRAPSGFLYTTVARLCTRLFCTYIWLRWKNVWVPALVHVLKQQYTAEVHTCHSCEFLNIPIQVSVRSTRVCWNSKNYYIFCFSRQVSSIISA